MHSTFKMPSVFSKSCFTNQRMEFEKNACRKNYSFEVREKTSAAILLTTLLNWCPRANSFSFYSSRIINDHFLNLVPIKKGKVTILIKHPFQELEEQRFSHQSYTPVNF